MDDTSYQNAPGWEHGDEPPCNTSANATFYDVVDARTTRRGVLMGGLAAAVTGVFGASFAGATAARAQAGTALLGFEPIATSEADTVVVPPGYRVQVLAPWGEPIDPAGPAHGRDASGADQAVQIGMHHDGMHFFPIDGSSTDGLLVMNHEYVEPRFLHAAYDGIALDSGAVVVENGQRVDDEVLKEINAHGVSVVRVSRGADGTWSIVSDPRNRRVTAATAIEISGPVRGSDHVRTLYSPDGTMVRGTINNCAHGVTPWNTYMAAEENWAGYFRNGDTEDQKPNLPREHARYGVPAGTSRYAWELAASGSDEFVRFDASTRGASPAEDYRNEPNGFGWMVEIDPFDPEARPVKRTALGRFAHEGVVFAPAVEGRPVVCYSGDDARFEYIYKFVSAQPYEAAGASGALLDEGTLYVARFSDDGTGTWLPLVHGEGPLTTENGFSDQADVLVNTRLAADLLGATKMDRPEWGAVDPNSGEVYFTLTNNSRRIQAQVDAVNPRADNQFGHIVRWREDGDDHAATTFSWDLFVIAGDARTSVAPTGGALGEFATFACPDGLWFDDAGRLWIQTDIGESAQNKGDFAQFGNNQMLCADPSTGEIRRFLAGPIGQEITGVVTTPDGRTMFVNVQHPGATTTEEDFAAGTLVSRWPDGGAAVPRSATLVITREDGGVIGA
ncbi:PhoX family protein [Salinarimonas chemoclinalis]|uniref:PhoX family protein n=1 Tax=Salinarimonas chemoclinalis TaxID=3241599 RepID=UPI0035580886